MDFRRTIFEPLKQAIIYNGTPNFTDLVEQATHCMQRITTACEVRGKETDDVCTNIKSTQKWWLILWTESNIRIATEAWIEARELSERIEDLLIQAEAKGWKRKGDLKFKELDNERVFDRANGPSSVITYLEGVVNTTEWDLERRQ